MMTDYTEDLRKFRSLGLDVGKLEQLAATLVETDRQLTEARRVLLTLRADKDRDGLAKQAMLISALQTSKDAAVEDVNDEVEALKTKAVEAGSPELPRVVGQIRSLDVRAISLLWELRTCLEERDQWTQEAETKYGILADFAHELGADPGGTSWEAPGHRRWQGAGKELELYTQRFISMSAGGRPEPGQEWTWFNRLRY